MNTTTKKSDDGSVTLEINFEATPQPSIADHSTLLAQCTCGSEVAAFDWWPGERHLYISTYTSAQGMGGILARLAAAWRLLCGRDNCGSEVILNKADAGRLKDWLATIPL